MERIKVLLAHRHQVVGRGLSRLLADERGIDVIATAIDGEEAVSMAEELKPDVAIIDIAMPKLSGIDAAKQIKSRSPTTAILMLSEYQFGTNVLPSLRAGALGYLLQSSPLSELISAIHSVHKGEEVFAPKAAADVLHSLATQRNDQLRSAEDLHLRELEILKLVTKGMSNRAIADELNISDRTVSTHLAHIFRKLQVNSRTEAVVHALKLGLITADDLG